MPRFAERTRHSETLLGYLIDQGILKRSRRPSQRRFSTATWLSTGTEKCTTFRNRKVHHPGAPLRSGCGPTALRLIGWPRTLAPVLEPVALALQGDDLRVVNEPVDQRGGDHLIAEDLAPGLEASIRGEDDRAALVAAGDEGEEQVRGRKRGRLSPRPAPARALPQPVATFAAGQRDCRSTRRRRRCRPEQGSGR